ncbi:phage tail sheath family protein [Corallococcus exercitus]|uniref:phage tail sheath family protein n=1 Tax=Corallococcus exercitus TaxID=2316736 RepID=UPI001C116389
MTAFIGFTTQGAINKPIQVHNFGEFEREFGGLGRESEVSYAVRQFFLNGGSEAWVVRTADGASKASVNLSNPSGAAAHGGVLTVTAGTEGAWGNSLRVDIDYDTSNPDSLFNLSVTEYKSNGTQLVANRTESHRNLSMDSQSAQYAVSTVNNTSSLIRLSRDPRINSALFAGLTSGWSESGDLSRLNLADLDANHQAIAISLNGDPATVIPIFDPSSPPADLDAVANSIVARVKTIKPANTAYSGFSGGVVTGTSRLRFAAGSVTGAAQERSSVRITSAPQQDAAALLKLGLANGGRETEAVAALRPAPVGNTSEDLLSVDLTNLPKNTVQMTVSTSVASTSTQFSLASAKVTYAPGEFGELASTLQSLIRASSAVPAFSKATVRVVGKRLQIISGVGTTDALIQFTDQPSEGQTDGLVARLGLNENQNVQRYSLGVGTAQGQQAGAVAGTDGTPPGASQIIGSEQDKTGLYALEDVNLLNLLCIPRTADLSENEGLAVISAATAYCTRRRAFFLVDPPSVRTSVSHAAQGIREWVSDRLPPERNAAVYWPNVLVPDPLDNYRLRSLPPSGTLAGLYARTDSARGVWKAPAGTEATLVNVQGMAYNVTDAENGVLNPLGINCLRSLPVYGRIAWGARTTRGADQQADEYKYVPIRRLALYIEESLYRGTQWVVFEPNDEPLWSQIRLNLGAFMHTLFRQGAFQGKSPREAYFVKCDAETTTQDDINRGIVNIVVGFAPLKPTEFVVIQLQQIAGQLEA